MSTLDYRNINTLWASLMVEALSRLGLTTAITCPGSRCTPLTVALARHTAIKTIPILDERSAAFFALGCAKQSHHPVAIICTSGTAGANFYPAIIEAKESHIPLLIFTADRPPELRACGSGQTIDQQKLFGNFVNWYTEMAVPQSNLLDYARQLMIQIWRKSLSPRPGPVHINCPFRDPLPPVNESLTISLDETQFFEHVFPPTLGQKTLEQFPSALWQQWTKNERGLIIAGPAQPQHPYKYCNAIAQLSNSLGWPVLAEGLSPVRNYQALNPWLISTYDCLLRNMSNAKQLVPKQVIQIGPLPTSKVLRQWLQQHQPSTWQVTPYALNVDPLHGKTQVIETSIEILANLISSSMITSKIAVKTQPSYYCQQWLGYEDKLKKKIDQSLQTIQNQFEGKISWILSKYLPEKTALIVANSMPIRDIESFWQPNDHQIQVYFNRGANGIDGTLSTAMGIANSHQHSILLTGDLAFLHDTNGLLNHGNLEQSLSVIVINNQGGGIFEMLPISDFNPPFEQYFATPQNVDISALCRAYGVKHSLITNWEILTKHLRKPQMKGQPKLEILEICTDRKADTQWRKTQIATLANNL